MQRSSAPPIHGGDVGSVLEKLLGYILPVTGGGRMQSSVSRIQVVYDLLKEEVLGSLTRCAHDQVLRRKGRLTRQ